MRFNPSSSIRGSLYTISSTTSLLVIPLLAYLVDEGIISVFWLGLIGVVNAGVFALARLNVTPDVE